jgi:glutamate dehydrogenase (NADP+)
MLSGAPTNGKAEEISNEELLEKECDLLIPAALESQIVEENAAQIKASLILELANGPTTPAADRILEAKGTIVIPDILANAGGVTVSYFEWAQNKAGYYWSEDEVRSRLREFLQPQAKAIWKTKQEKGIDMRTAAYVLALRRIGDAVAAHGTKAYFQS